VEETDQENRLPGPVRPLRPLVELVARMRATVHTKLLAGFLLISLLLLAMGVLSTVVINRMTAQVERISELQGLSDLARQGIYAVTAQSHYRAMALNTGVSSWNGKIAVAKQNFASDLAAMETIGGAGIEEAVDRMREIDARYTSAGEEVIALFEAGEVDRALDLHLNAEHEISHELEDELNGLIASSTAMMSVESEAFKADRRFLTATVAVFSGLSLLGALGLGAILSWSLIQPVRKVDVALARIADGDFDLRVEVPNRDEFGRLTVNLNRTSSRLASLYHDLKSLNENLERTIEEQMAQLRRTEQLRRYVSPQVADAVLSGSSQVVLASTRRNLTVLVTDIRGFTELSERMEPEELVDALNQYFTAMTDIVFSHGGTLDKYLGDGLLAFFGDPIPFEDHAERAVAAAVEMQGKLSELRHRWMLQYEEELEAGIGISTGYVTVGNIGSPTRSEYTVIGNHVNLASRLATAASPGQILMAERTMAAVHNQVRAAWVQDISLKGIQRPVRVFEVVGKELNLESSPPLS
jgi:class 3 adenylate cyclase